MIFNVKPLTDFGEDKLTGQQHRKLSDISLFIDSATPSVPSCLPNCEDAILRGLDMSGQQLYGDFHHAFMGPKGTTPTNLSGTIMRSADLADVDLMDAVLDGAILKGADRNTDQP